MNGKRATNEAGRAVLWRRIGVTCLAACLALARGAAAEVERPVAWQKAVGEDTILLLLPEAAGKTVMTDVAGRQQVQVTGGEVVQDPDLGPCVRFGDGDRNGIKVKDRGNAGAFKGGVTFEAWVFLETPLTNDPKRAVTLALKMGSYAWSLTGAGKLNSSWMVVPTEPVATDRAGQYDYYPLGFGEINGEMEIPVGQWVHLAVTYDERTKTFRSWIDGSIDRERTSHIEGDLPLCYKPGSDYLFLTGARNCKVAGIRLRAGARQPGPVPRMAMFVNQFPWEDKLTVTLDRIDDTLSFPLEVAVMIQYPPGAAATVARARIAKAETTHVDIPMRGWRNTMSLLAVKVFSGNREVFSGQADIVQPRPASVGLVTVNPDRSISIGGKKTFPLMMYHVFPKDYPELARLGFNILTPRSAKLQYLALAGNGDDDIAEMRAALDTAVQNGVNLTLNANASFNHMRCVDFLKDHPGLVAWYSFDEPWGRLDKVRHDYNAIKLTDPNHPVIAIQNNVDRMKETAQGVDILGVDVYPLPNVSLRSVAAGTRAAVAGVFGRKPVWTVLPSYAYKKDIKLPTRDELRCMVYLAVCAGANGIGIYTWDEEELKSWKEKGYYMKNYPESIGILSNVVAEIRQLEPILLTTNAPGLAAFEPRNPALHAAVKVVEGKRYLFLVNDNRKPEQGSLVVQGSGSATARPVPACGFADALTFQDGKAVVSLPSLGAAVFELP